MPARAVIFDADGVLIKPPALFSRHYAAQHGLDPESFLPFFKGDFELALRGKADLKDLIAKHSGTWHWKGDPQLLLNQWFEYENHPNLELLDLIEGLRESSVPVFLDTSQERNRGDYFRTQVFPGVFDDIFVSCELGFTKNDEAHWPIVLDRIAGYAPGILPNEIIFFDDSQSHVKSATKAGLDARFYLNNEQVKEALQPLSIRPLEVQAPH